MVVLSGAARRRRARDERTAFLRDLAAARGWSERPALPSVVTRHPVPRLAGPDPAAADLVLGGAWRGREVELASVLLRPAGRRAAGGRRPDDVLLLAALELPPVAGRLVAVVAAGDLDVSGSTASLAARCRPAVLQAVRDGVLAEGDGLALGEGSLALAGAWRPAIAREDAVDAWFALLVAVAEQLTAPTADH
ncbi:hypothetical protein [Kineococcus rubinsiae]|uniref:hypothetical protein n=1 Tax=Kineococcus rubinsiae TaxID=2609562 RepID=UPI00143051BD|nr:hypothetical protein [Kineococcus rubinsiae]NIZ92044.1 hypothetical protein [Kineococcus rubinsiae]